MNIGYVFEKGDAVLISVFLLLTIMSVVSWYIIFWKFFKLRKERSYILSFQKYKMAGEASLPAIRSCAKGSLAALFNQSEKLRENIIQYEPEARKEIVSVNLAQVLDIIRVWMDRGLTVLASVGSTAPFIGLFGTVWGIYNALTDIATAGNASLNVVAGPMGEALVATAVGLFAAIPAVLAYNTLVRLNRVLLQDLRHVAEQISLDIIYAPKKTTVLRKAN